jgi:hypothetical protein
MIRVSIKDMIVGERAYTVPWSIQVDTEGRCWIRGDYTFTDQPRGTSNMPIKRDNDGFEVQVSRGLQYERAHISPETRSQMDLLPVIKIK